MKTLPVINSSGEIPAANSGGALRAAVFYEFDEQRMRFVRAAFEFRVELYTDKERIFCRSNLRCFDKQIVRRSAADDKTGFLHLFTVFVVEFVPVPMTFFDKGG